MKQRKATADQFMGLMATLNTQITLNFMFSGMLVESNAIRARDVKKARGVKVKAKAIVLYYERTAAMATEPLQPLDLVCGTLYPSSCAIQTSPTDCFDES